MIDTKGYKKTPLNRGTAAIPLLCLSHEKVSTPFTPFKWRVVNSYCIPLLNVIFYFVHLAADFGVSCQMMNPQDKRRTYIGTPYWYE